MLAFSSIRAVSLWYSRTSHAEPATTVTRIRTRRPKPAARPLRTELSGFPMDRTPRPAGACAAACVVMLLPPAAIRQIDGGDCIQESPSPELEDETNEGVVTKSLQQNLVTDGGLKGPVRGATDTAERASRLIYCRWQRIVGFIRHSHAECIHGGNLRNC